MFVVLTRKHVLLVDARREKILYDIQLNNVKIKEQAVKGKTGVIVKARTTAKVSS